MEVKRFDQAAVRVSDFVRSLANPTRLRILCALVTRECSVTILAAATGASMSQVSRHLALLRKDHIVKARRERQTVFYALADDTTGKFVATLAEAFCRRESQTPSPGPFHPHTEEKYKCP
jgi:DNA-binding transcriptional ArsR family regulator